MIKLILNTLCQTKGECRN